MTAAVPAVLAASLLGSLHCAAMCGGLVAAYAGKGAGAPAHAAYSLGRLAAYVALGAAAGAVGGVFAHTAALAGIQRGAALLSGALLVVWGAHALLAACGVLRPLHAPAALTRAFGSSLRRAQVLPVPARAAALGLLSGLLPCGWLWAFVATAAGTGAPAPGAVVMAVFWLGTLPVLVGLGAGAARFAGPLRRRLPALSAAVILALGLLVAWRGAAPLFASTPEASCCHVR
ncbi:MAG TPA: sulfite exporter TauE/SafE family protein [Candidatus Polarisedimenticolaceae bacterium]|nr:sulfite exporter TauE/SafE family protein [Candidatus Polarisedimenticolaceae bacterium]